MLADQRAYQLYSAILLPNLKEGASLPAPGVIFPSLKALESSQDDDDDEVDPTQSWRDITRAMGLASGGLT